LRDLQVITTGLIPAYQGVHGSTAGLDRLTGTLEEMAEQARSSLRETLESERSAAFLLDLMQYTEGHGWLLPARARQLEKPGPRVDRYAAKSLGRRWRKVRKAARHIETLSVEQRHALRKELKKLRYAAEFFGPLFRPSRVKPFVASLTRLQDVFGEMNDTAMLEARLGELPAEMQADAGVQYAAGLLVGTFRTWAEMHWHDARQLWSDVQKRRTFWS
jgi:triphosphatase